MLFGLAALAHECPTVSIDALSEIPAPAVFVLGERHGSTEDLGLATSFVKALADRKPVRLGMEAVHEVNQPVLDAFRDHEVGKRKLPSRLNWKKTWGFAYKPYKKLVTSSRFGVEVRAAGLKLGPKPADREVGLPEGYAERLMAAMGSHGHQMSDEVRERFPVSMAWRDFRIAELSQEGWDRQGYLVVLTGRGHVEGGQGTNWQLEKMLDVPVYSVVLAHEGAECLDGDRVLVKMRE